MKSKTKFFFTLAVCLSIAIAFALNNFQTLKKNYIIAFRKSGIIVHFNSAGKLDGEVDTYLNGKITQEETFKNDLLDGWAFAFYPNGNIKTKTFYKKNKIDGVELNYYNNRKIKSKESFGDGKREGFKITYYQNGQIIQSLFRKNDKDEGIEYAYYESGKLKYKRNWLNDKPYGDLYFYYEDNKVKIYHTYDILGEKFYLSIYEDSGKLLRSEGGVFSKNIYSKNTVDNRLIMLNNNAIHNNIRDLYLTVSNPPHNSTATKIIINKKLCKDMTFPDNNTVKIANAFPQKGIYNIVIDGIFIDKSNKIPDGFEYKLTVIRSL